MHVGKDVKPTLYVRLGVTREKGKEYGVRQFISHVHFYISIFDVLNTSMAHPRARAMSPFILKCNICLRILLFLLLCKNMRLES